MPRFLYKAKTGPSESKEGVIEADSERAAIYKISQMGYFPVDVKEETQGGSPVGDGRKVSPKDMAVFTRQLSDLLASGLSILKALDVLSAQAEAPGLKKALSDISSFVKEGGTFSGGLARHPGVFSNLYVSMIKAGETAGMLEDVLNRLADYAETEDQLRGKVRSALAYPALMTLVGIVTIVVLLTFVIPRLVTIFQDMGQALPIPTLILIRTSGFVTHYGWFVAVVLALAGFIINRRGKTKEGRLVIDNFKLKVFGFGNLIKKSEIARFTRTLAVLLINGVPMMQSLEVAGTTVENAVLKFQIEELSRDVSEGVSFSRAMLKAKSFPLFAVNMISVGDESGHLDKALLKVSESCERDVDRTVRNVTALLEPCIILAMGSIVGFIVISMLLPIFQINLAVK